MDLGIKEVLERIDGRLERLENRMEGLENRMEGLENRMEGLENRMDAVQAGIARLSVEISDIRIAQKVQWSAIGELAAVVAEMREDIEKLETKVGRVAARLDRVTESQIAHWTGLFERLESLRTEIAGLRGAREPGE